MVATRTPSAKVSERPFIITRTFKASRMLVFKVRTSSTPRHGRKKSLDLSSVPHGE